MALGISRDGKVAVGAMDVSADGSIMVGYGNNKKGLVGFYADMAVLDADGEIITTG